jgi:hypothetical protein
MAAPALAQKSADTLRITWRDAIPDVDPYNSQRTGMVVAFHAFDCLVYRDPVTMEMKPALATSWKQVDATTIDFTLREGVMFQNGDPFTADDVVYTINDIIHDKQVAIPAYYTSYAGAEKIDDFHVHVNFLKQESFSASRKARVAERHFLGEGDSTMLDCSEASTVTMHSPMDTVRLYVPRVAIQDFVGEEFGSSEVYLKSPQQVIRDPILYHIGACISGLLEHPEESNSLLVDYIALSLQNHLYRTYSATPASSPKARGGLAPWQERRAKEAMEADFDKEITIARLAHDCRLSASQFGRAFRQSTGCTPHRWRLQRRVERAQVYY